VRHDVSQGTLKEVMCRGTQFQDTANIIEKFYPKRLSEKPQNRQLGFRESYLPETE
jgi:hypothetical protein